MLKSGLAVLAFALATPAFAAATLLTTDAGYTGRGLNLSAAANGSYNFTFGPVLIDGLTFTVVSDTTNSGSGGVLGQGGYGLGNNGTFGGDAVYAAVDAPTGYFQLLGTTGYSQFGLFMNYFVDSAGNFLGETPTIWALDSAGSVIGTGFDLLTEAPINTPGGFNAFSFRGVGYDDGTLIYGLRMGGSYILATGTSDGVPPSVPEPATWAMLIAGFGMVGSAMRRRRVFTVSN